MQQILLLQEMEEFVQSAGEHGIVLFTLGSMIRNMTEERANTIASAFAQIPQKVDEGIQLWTTILWDC